MFKRQDILIISVICLFMGVFLVSQYYASKKYEKIITPENNDVLAIEVGRLTKSNADLRQEVAKLTNNLDAYRSASESKKEVFDQYQSDLSRFDNINGVVSKSGQGIILNIDGALSVSQVVDLVDAIKNVGSGLISINGTRLTLNTPLPSFAGINKSQILVLGNNQLLKSALTRKGGIIEDLSNQGIKISVLQSDKIEIPSGKILNFNYSKIVTN